MSENNKKNDNKIDTEKEKDIIVLDEIEENNKKNNDIDFKEEENLYKIKKKEQEITN